jgi:hypothetical protein
MQRAASLRSTTTWFCLILSSLIWLPGCGSSLYQPVQGKVLYQGEPAVGAMVIFHPVTDDSLKAMRPSGQVAEDGTFFLTSEKSGDGASVGEYHVVVRWMVESNRTANRAPEAAGLGGPGGEESGESRAMMVDKLGNRYSDPKTSGLRATVRSGVNDLPAFELK